MEYIFTTDAVPEAGRELHWQNEFLRVLEIGVRLERPQPFQGKIRSRDFGTATLVNVQLEHQDARPYLLRHDPSADPPGLSPGMYVLAKLAGRSRYHYDGGSKPAGPGDVLLLDGGQPWAAESPRGKHQTLVFKLDRQMVLAALGEAAPPAVRMLRAEQKLGGLIESYLRSLVRVDAHLARAQGPRLVAHFCELLALAAQATLRNPPQAQARTRTSQLEAIREYLEQHLGDPTLDPESVANRFGMSTRYLHKLHSERGQSFSKWLLQRRLERCRRNLDDPVLAERSIAEIALDCGFNDLTHFGRCFRAAYGLTPREWRRYGPMTSRGRKSTQAPAARPPRLVVAGASASRARAPARAKSAGWLDGDEIALVREQFACVAAQAESFAVAFYARFFSAWPAARELFRGDIAEQGPKLMRMVALLVTKADTPEALAEPLAQLGERHVGYGVSADDYAPMSEALLATLEEALAGHFDAHARRCWSRLFERVVLLMHPAAAARSA